MKLSLKLMVSASIIFPWLCTGIILAILRMLTNIGVILIAGTSIFCSTITTIYSVVFYLKHKDMVLERIKEIIRLNSFSDNVPRKHKNLRF